MEEPKQLDAKNEMLSAAVHWKRAALMSKTVSAFKDTNPDDSDDDVDTKRQIKYGSRHQAAWAIFSEYCDNSTIHGIRYLGEKKRPCLERFFWVTVFGFSIYLCVTLTMNIWDKWNNYPVIVSFAEKSTPVWQIPFPAVTVCTETKSRQSVFNFTEVFWKLTDRITNVTTEELTRDEYAEMNVVAQVCDPHLLNTYNFGTKVANGKELIEILDQVMPLFNETYVSCKWRNTAEECRNLFRRFVTDEGICYSFNSLSAAEIFRSEGLDSDFTLDDEHRSATEWNVEDGYSSNASPDTYPNRVLGPGARAGLDLTLRGLQKDFDNLCRGPVQGFKILLHTPGEVAQVSQQYFRIPFDQEVLISIKPNIITTSEGLKHYDPHRRQCYFQKERHLRYFQIYTQNNCELECLANFTYTKCGCVKFSMPHHAEIPICGSANIICLNAAEDALLLKEFNQGLETSGENHRGATDCNCLPSCTSIDYEAEISQADVEYNSVQTNPSDFEDSKLSRVSIFFKEAQFLTSKRSELYGITDFLANCGGLLGLFMGVSMLSIVEIIYFCTVRLLTNLNMRRKKRKEIAKDYKTPKEA